MSGMYTYPMDFVLDVLFLVVELRYATRRVRSYLRWSLNIDPEFPEFGKAVAPLAGMALFSRGVWIFDGATARCAMSSF